jgi:hypothetical protein
MSQENVEVVRSYVETYNSTDFGPSDWSAADFFVPDADYYPASLAAKAECAKGALQALSRWRNGPPYPQVLIHG